MESIYTCKICKKNSLKKFYSGSIRSGKFGNKTEGLIFKCENCEVEKLEESLCLKELDYSSANYRKLLNQKNDNQSYNEEHDHDIKNCFEILKNYSLRDKIVADIGCAGGGFLDYLSGVAKKSIAIEPCQEYHKELIDKGYNIFDDTNVKTIEDTVDFAFSFQVIEHVENPTNFLNGIFKILKKGGILILSTPNLNDFMIKVSNEYKEFFYRIVHRWYFNEKSIEFCIKQTGFKLLSIRFLQKYPLSNSLLWLRDKSPNGFKKINGINHNADNFWKGYLEDSGQADTMFIILQK